MDGIIWLKYNGSGILPRDVIQEEDVEKFYRDALDQ